MSLFKVGDVLALPYFPNQEDPKEGTARYILIVEIFNDSLFYNSFYIANTSIK
jgi:hypothetical protein